MPDVFILGAGFSRAISHHMPLLNDLSTMVMKEFSEEQRTAPDSLYSNIEHLMSFLSQEHPWLSQSDILRNRAHFLEVTTKIAEIFDLCTERVIETEWIPEWLNKLIDYWVLSSTKVITTNYDVLLEIAIRKFINKKFGHDLYCRDLYPIAMTRGAKRIDHSVSEQSIRRIYMQLYKLHGSINWFYSGNRDSTYEPLYYVDSGQRSQEYGKDRENEDRRALTGKVPLIVPPVADKYSYFKHDDIRYIWEQAGHALSGASRVFCLGYSLPETDTTMGFFLKSHKPSLQSRKKVEFYVVNTDKKSAAKHFKKSLEQTHFRINTDYIRANAIPEFVDDYTIWPVGQGLKYESV